ncbi:hypothetical protein OPKNFCMD_2710 [Methylobacterium crusticola]|uniref:Sulfotransferase family protein n=1 Tax=Methylobacterium crusticola TaxID=1697972 RepID=A0ABQ4QYH4_9HYPH|nr:sulfotransferase family 2 domain-containing protein [Methylobacterium crusticola]GJD49974.1 hypothetical protein OPKNFCMD_2710 [Methylobacterium crusticola]
MSILLFEPPGCVFIRVRKTGSTSVVRGLFGGRDRAVLATADGRWDPRFDGRPTAAFVRNPFDRLVSCLRMFQDYAVATRDEEALRSRLDLAALMDAIEDDAIPLDRDAYLSKLRLHALPMTHRFYCLDRAGFVGRFERFERDYRALAAALGLPAAAVPHERRRAPVDYRRWYSPPLRSRAESLLRQDLATFGYRFDAEPAGSG